MKLNWVLAVIVPGVLQVAVIYCLLGLSLGQVGGAGIGTAILALPCLLLCLPTNNQLARRYLGRPLRAAIYACANSFLLPFLTLLGLWCVGQIMVGLEYYSIDFVLDFLPSFLLNTMLDVF